MQALTHAEQILGFAPLALMACVFVFLRRDRPFGFTESGRKYRKVNPTEFVPLLATRRFWLVFGTGVVLAAAWALGTAIADAAQSGTVSLPGRRGRPRPVVQWEAAWAYFLGLGLLIMAFVLPLLAPPRGLMRPLLVVGSLVIVSLAYALLLFSPMLSSATGAVFLIAVFALLCCVWWLNRQFGRWVALSVWAGCVMIAILFAYVRT
jgi:hypothetical protein